MTTRAVIPLVEALDVLPMSLNTIYTLHCRGRLPWLTRIGPHGNRTRQLWIDVQAAVKWWQIGGKSHVANRLNDIAKGDAPR